MELSSKLIKNFAKEVVSAATDTDDTPIQLVGTVVKSGNELYVQLDGAESNSLTPVSNTATYSEGDRVMVTIENHVATITGNYTTPSNDHDYISEIVQEEAPSGSYEIVEWAIGTSNTEAPDNSTTYPAANWSNVMTLPTASTQYLWRRKVTITETGVTGTVVENSIQRAEVMDDLYVFMNSVSADAGHTTIDGGTINISNAIYSGLHSSLDSPEIGAYLGTDGISYTGKNYTESSNTVRKLFSIRKGDTSSSLVLSLKTYLVSSEKWYDTPDFSLDSSGKITCKGVTIKEGNLVWQGNAMSDMVISYKTSGSWTYKQWRSGRREAWGTFTTGSLSMSSVGVAYRSALKTYSLPSSFFTETPKIFITPASDTGTISIIGKAISTSQYTLYAWATNDNSRTYTYDIYVVQPPNQVLST